ncbi:MAG: pyridoxamine 5'-phosphate oxidase family protein [Ilumatobacter sp.]|nr:MAG: pyridoxamine 5'-phosphate oxidase family protein [Ilumatobacter sp.]
MATPEGMRELTDSECWELMRANEQQGGGVGRIAVAIMNQPDIFPVNYVVDHGSVIFRTAEGTKLAAAVLGTSVAFEADGYEPEAGEAWSVVIRGRAVELEQVHGRFDAADLPLFPWHASPKNRVVRIEPEIITGRRFVVVEDRRPVD